MDKIDLQHYNQSEKYVKAIKKQYQALIEEISRLTTLYDIDTEKPFAFDDYPALKKQVNDLLNSFAENTTAIIEVGKQKQWEMGTKKVMQYLPFAEKDLFNYQDNPLIVSDRVWKYTSQYRGELEMALDLGISKGQGANSLAREIKQYLNNPDKLFRRVRDKHGNLHLSKKAKEYHPGQGVYRSSFKNAQRLARTETNIAYHNASWQHYQKFDFVVGFEVRLSNNPKHCPFCSAMTGKYPKEFKFNGWHPNCRCTTIPILAKDIDNIRDEEIIKDLPPAMSKWLEDNEDKIKTAKSKPYFVRDNKEIIFSKIKSKIKDFFTPVSSLEKIFKELENQKIEYREVKLLKAKLTETEIISKVGGGDLTKGSCASLCLAYSGNKAGWEVYDFRDGESRYFFSRKIDEIIKLSGGYVEKDTNDFKAVERLLKNAEIDKEYILATGRHASIVRKRKDTGWEYLELQSPTDNGYKRLTMQKLKSRFACQKTHTLYKEKYQVASSLIDIENLNNEIIKDMLGYINTAEKDQKKGIKGKVK